MTDTIAGRVTAARGKVQEARGLLLKAYVAASPAQQHRIGQARKLLAEALAQLVMPVPVPLKPPPLVRKSPFPLPMIFTAQGTAPATQDWSPTGLAMKVKGAGFKTVAVEIGNVTRDYVKALQDTGLFVVIWNVVGAELRDRIAELQPNGVMPQIESDSQYDLAVKALTNIHDFTLPKALVTT
jgi:hypothetical protein